MLGVEFIVCGCVCVCVCGFRFVFYADGQAWRIANDWSSIERKRCSENEKPSHYYLINLSDGHQLSCIIDFEMCIWDFV